MIGLYVARSLIVFPALEMADGTLGDWMLKAPVEIRDVIMARWPREAWECMACIGWYESGYRAEAHNPGTPEVPEDSWGIWQINVRAHPQWAKLDLTDVSVNAELAHHLWRFHGYSPWFHARRLCGCGGG